jgi:RNA polymerase subunit RPABC4/transcription elongation factor Spt4
MKIKPDRHVTEILMRRIATGKIPACPLCGNTDLTQWSIEPRFTDDTKTALVVHETCNICGQQRKIQQ